MSTANAAARREAIAVYAPFRDSVEPDLQGLVQLAASVCGVSTAVLNIIDDKLQHQIAAVGFTAASCAREDSMCNVVLENPATVAVRDARVDARFASNPFVTGVIADVRFYASSPLVTPSGVAIGTLCVFDEEPRELTPEQAHAIELLAHQVVDVLELRRTARDLQESNARLTMFASQVSHDLRNPLAALSGFLQVAQDSGELEESPTASYAVDRAEAAADRMSSMVTDLLAYAKAGARPRRDEVDLGGVLRAVREDLDAVILETRAEIAVDTDAVVVGDPMMLRMLFQNLLANAIKFGFAAGHAPHIAVGVAELPGAWRITVDDDGPGVPAADRKRVFGLMERAAGDDVPGLGIGLSACRRIVDAHDGSIFIEDSPLGGARIAITLPRLDAVVDEAHRILERAGATR
jgi:signal transduction histidine kinase